MASIYSYETAETITSGLQGCNTCDEAAQAAQRIADERAAPVVLEDDDGNWLVHPSDSGAQSMEKLPKDWV